MFDNMKAMGALTRLMSNRGELEAAGKRVRERIAAIRAEGSAGGGLVRAVATGGMQIEKITIDPGASSVLGGASVEDVARMESMVLEAVNDALRKARAESAEVARREAEALGLDELGPIKQALSARLSDM